MESVLVPLTCKIFNPNYEKMKRIDFLSDHDESSRSVQVEIFDLCILYNILKMDFWPFHALHALEIKPGYCCKDLCLDNKGVSRSKMVND